ncbi:MAG: hypothetical protein ACLP22_14320 [Solirubrobacteraceae bacterium]
MLLEVGEDLHPERFCRGGVSPQSRRSPWVRPDACTAACFGVVVPAPAREASGDARTWVGGGWSAKRHAAPTRNDYSGSTAAAA